MKCKEELGQTVIPVFYKVDPSDVKKLRGYFGKVFEKTCEGKSKEDTEKWRHALEKVATIAGYDSRTWFVLFYFFLFLIFQTHTNLTQKFQMITVFSS